MTIPTPDESGERIVSIVLPDGYASAEEFAKDCGFELADRRSTDTRTEVLEEAAKVADGFAAHQGESHTSKVRVSIAKWIASDIRALKSQPSREVRGEK